MEEERKYISISIVVSLVILVVVGVIVVVGSGLFGGKALDGGKLSGLNEATQSVVAPTSSPKPTPSPLPPVGEPVAVRIPAIQVNTSVVRVGVTADNVMEVPRDASQVGWYSKRAKPGEVGGAILTGHYDTPTGRPAVFFRLGQIKQGDEVVVTTKDGEELVFRVDSVVSEPYKSFPVNLVYQEYNNEKLVVITCDGVWNSKERTYSERLVIFADLWKKQKQS